MGVARKKQSIQDWITQQWVILFGKRIDEGAYKWLLGPFGQTSGIGQKFIKQLAEREHLVFDRQKKDKGLIESIHQLNLPPNEIQSHLHHTCSSETLVQYCTEIIEDH